MAIATARRTSLVDAPSGGSPPGSGAVRAWIRFASALIPTPSGPGDPAKVNGGRPPRRRRRIRTGRYTNSWTPAPRRWYPRGMRGLPSPAREEERGRETIAPTEDGMHEHLTRRALIGQLTIAAALAAAARPAAARTG